MMPTASVTAWIDGRAVETGGGTTILQAAEQLGVSIPTLCHGVTAGQRRLPLVRGRD